MSGHLLRRARWAREPGGVRLLFLRAWLAPRKLGISLKHRLRLLRLRPSSVDHPRRWRSRPTITITGWTSSALAAILLAWMLRAVFVTFVLRKPWNVPPNADTFCRGVGISCDALSGWVTSLLSIALASVVFLFWRFWRVQRRYRVMALTHARDLVPTAGPIFGRIVGRDILCSVLMEDLRERRARRPHVLVGGVGTGKTAVLVLLTEMLARRNAVPVPIRLRDADPLDFGVLAKNRFTEAINEYLASDTEGERIWRRLLQDGRIVVLADGLEEALSGAQNDEERDSKIRIAIRKAYDQRLPLLIASRPHTPLRDMDATIHELEPLSEDAALSYVAEHGSTEDEGRLNWIVETADVADAPLYLQITKDIYSLDMLDQIATRQAEILGTPGHDPSRLRVRLLETWVRALVRGDLRPEVPLRPEEREATVVWLSALACVGLKDDSLEVRLDSPISEKIRHQVEKRLAEIDQRTDSKFRLGDVDQRLAADWGARLRLVEPLAGRVRFQHSLIQAYLGSRLMGAALHDREYMKEALFGTEGRQQHPSAQGPAPRGIPSGTIANSQDSERTGPGREFLIALVLYSRSKMLEEQDSVRWPSKAADSTPDSPGAVCHTLADAAVRRRDNKALDIYAAALEISSIEADYRCTADGGGTGSQEDSTVPAVNSISHIDLARQILSRWPHIHSGDPQTLEEAKLGLVCRFGDALRTLAGMRHQCSNGLGYAQLYQICRAEGSYRIRLAAVQEIGRGGTAAYLELERGLALPGKDDEGCPACREGRDEKQAPGSHPSHLGRTSGALSVNTQAQWAQQVSAWLAPLLITSVDTDTDDHGPGSPYQHARDCLERWLQHVKHDNSHSGLTISQEIALAQGFKYAANRRYRHIHTRPTAVGYLQEEALEMLKHARYWFSQLTLIQALCLWQIQVSEPMANGQYSNPDAIVNHWLNEIGDETANDGRGGRRIHPFVEAAAVLASRALETGHPERFIWMDECDLVTRVGSSQGMTASQGERHDQWILSSMGWSGLDWRAQQLVADVLLLLNLAERGEQSDKIEQWLGRADKDIAPPCIRRDRLALKPDCTVGTADSNPPGSSCLDGCPFDLCPYPPKGLQPHRAELSEAFCRHQVMLLRRKRIGRRTARWQGVRASQMRAFWSEMANRARIGPAGR
jgi:hypothetical protein